MRLVYYGTPSIAVPPLLRLIQDGRPPLLVVTRRDRPKGRGLQSAPSPVREAALAHGIPVVTPARAGAPEEVARLLDLKPDLLVLVAYGQILSREVLAVPAIGAINLHFSLLPRHRGASPVQAAILAGDAETGVTTMWMTEGLDEGPTFLAESTPIGPEEDAGALGARLASIGARCLSETLSRIERGEIERRAQEPAQATHAPKIRSEDARLSFGEDAAAFARKVRAFTPEPGAYLDLEGERLQILAASPGDVEGGTPPGDAAGQAPPGTVRAVDRTRGLEIQLQSGSVWLRTVKPGGRRAMGGSDYANGARLKPGARLPARGPAA